MLGTYWARARHALRPGPRRSSPRCSRSSRSASTSSRAWSASTRSDTRGCSRSAPTATTLLYNNHALEPVPVAAGLHRRRRSGRARRSAALSLRVSGLYFAITTFVFTLVLTVRARSDLTLHRRLRRSDRADLPRLPVVALTWLGPVADLVLHARAAGDAS